MASTAKKIITVTRPGIMSSLGLGSACEAVVEAVREGVAMPEHPV
jgi:hypothetical protein